MEQGKWLIIFTKPGQEKKVSDLLTSKGVVNYCPLNKITKGWTNNRQIFYQALFPSYVFVYITDETINLKSLVNGISFVYWLNEFAVISNDEITAIKDFLDEFSSIDLEKTPINLKDHFRIIYGPLVVREGDKLEVRNSPVSVILPSLGYIIVAKERNRNTVKVVYKNQEKKTGLQRIFNNQ